MQTKNMIVNVRQGIPKSYSTANFVLQLNGYVRNTVTRTSAGFRNEGYPSVIVVTPQQ